MKKFFVLASLAFLVACKKDGNDTTTPKGIILTAVQALSDGDTAKFKSLLSERALQKYGSADQQNQLKNQLGNVRDLELSDEKVLSHTTTSTGSITVSQVDVMRTGQVIYNVVTRCTENTSSYTHQVCHTYDPNPRHDDYNHGGSGGGGGYSGGSHDDSGSYGGGQNHDYLRPGDSNHGSSDGGGSSDDGGKPGRGPGGPGRFPIVEPAYSDYSYGAHTECHDETSYDTSVNCSIIDVR